VVAAHLSRTNNRPDLAAATIADVLGAVARDVVVADAFAGSPWLGRTLAVCAAGLGSSQIS
jgi:hypothetical protein